MIRRFNLFLPIYLVTTSYLMWSVAAHELEDGFVDRAVEVVIRDETATIKFFLSLNENTMAGILGDWQDTKLSELRSSRVRDDFESVLLKQLAERLRVSLHDQNVEMEPIGIEESAKHHFDFVAEFRCELPEAESLELLIEDGNFQKMDGTARYSLKAMGSTMILRSNVAPIIIRAKRHQLGVLASDLRAKTCKIAATVVTGSQSSKNGVGLN